MNVHRLHALPRHSVCKYSPVFVMANVPTQWNRLVSAVRPCMPGYSKHYRHACFFSHTFNADSVQLMERRFRPLSPSCLQAAAAERQVRARFNQEMGVAAREERVEAYMRAATKDGSPMLDPTGRLKPLPSQARTHHTYTQRVHTTKGGLSGHFWGIWCSVH